MLRRILYALMGIIFGLVGRIAWGLLLGGDTATVSTWPIELFSSKLVLWGLGGMAAGILIVEPPAVEPVDQSYNQFFYPPWVEMQPARCGWCGGQGRKLFFFRCPVCGGQGNVLAVRPKKRCAWCRGAGRRLFCRCRACGGSGWFSPHSR